MRIGGLYIGKDIPEVISDSSNEVLPEVISPVSDNATSTIEDIPRVPQTGTVPVTRKIKPISVVYGKVTKSRSGTSNNWNDPEFDFKEIAKCLVTESFFRRIVDKYTELIWRNGYKLSGKNPASIRYIVNRFVLIQQATQKPFNQFLREFTQQLVTYNNTFIEKVRNRDASGGRPRTTFYGKYLEPVAGYFIVDATSMKISKDEHGVPKKYRQEIGSVDTVPEWNPEDMIHVYKDREAGLTFGTPMVIPVIDDIQALRRIEENVEMLIFGHVMPLQIYQVGDKDNPPTEKDIEEAQYILRSMPAEGMLVAPYTHNVQAIGAEGRALRCEGYLEYYKNRVLAGLGASEVALGYGGTASRSTADTVEKGMYNTVREFQNVIRTFIEESIINELLLEGGFQIDENNRVDFFFPEIDIDDKIKFENHIINMYTNNVMTEEESRIAIGLDPLTDDQRYGMYFNMVELPRTLIMAADEPVLTMAGMPKYVRRVLGNVKSQPTTSGPTGRAALVKSLDMPKNQYGQKMSPGTTKDYVLDDASRLDLHHMILNHPDMVMEQPVVTDDRNLHLRDNITPQSANLLDRLHYSTYSSMLENLYSIAQNDTVGIIRKRYNNIQNIIDASTYDGSDIAMILGLTINNMIDKSAAFILNSFSEGVMNAGRQANIVNITMDTTMGRDYLRAKNQEWIGGLSKILMDTSITTIRSNTNINDMVSNIVTVFDSNIFRLKLGCRNEIQRAYNIGTFLAGIAMGFRQFQLDSIPYDDDGICRTHYGVVYTIDANTSLDDIPPGYMTHHLCTCTIKLFK